MAVGTAPEWVKRAYLAAEDEDALVYMWLKSYAHSAYGMARGAHRTHTPEEMAYWAAQAPVVEALLGTVDVEVVCDPGRVRTTSEGPAVIYGFAATSGDVVHWVGVKRKVVRAGLGGDIVRDLLGSRLTRSCGYSHDLVEMRTGACGVRIPREWFSDSTWIGRTLIGARKAA